MLDILTICWSFLKQIHGLSSRIPFKIKFEDYTEDELLSIFLKFAKEDNYEIQEECKNLLLEEFKKVKNTINSGNGRYVRNIYEKVKILQANRISNSGGDINYIAINDVQEAIKQQNNIHARKNPIRIRNRKSI